MVLEIQPRRGRGRDKRIEEENEQEMKEVSWRKTGRGWQASEMNIQYLIINKLFINKLTNKYLLINLVQIFC